jgi:hypothetical protein
LRQIDTELNGLGLRNAFSVIVRGELEQPVEEEVGLGLASNGAAFVEAPSCSR